MLEPLRGDYDYVFLDCPPSISLVSESVFEAADALLVPIIPATLSSRTLDQLEAVLNETPQVLAFFSMVDVRKRMHREVMERLRAAHGSMLETAIPASAEVERMGAERDRAGPIRAERPWRGARTRRCGATCASGLAASTLRPRRDRSRVNARRRRRSATASYEADPADVHRVLLLYSGGLDTSVMLKWIQERYDAEVVALTVNLGQPGEDYDVIRAKARELGAIDCHVVDAREEFARDYVAPAIKANAIYGLGYPLFTALGRPLIAKLAVEHARDNGCDTIAHGCTGKGNDQVRIEATIATLAPELKVIAPVRSWQHGTRGGDPLRARARDPGQGRHRGRAVLDRRQPVGALQRGAVDRGARPRAGGRRVPARHPPEEAPDEAELVTVGFERGRAGGAERRAARAGRR